MVRILTYILSLFAAFALGSCSSSSGSLPTALQNTILVGGQFGSLGPALTAISNENGTWKSVNKNTSGERRICNNFNFA